MSQIRVTDLTFCYEGSYDNIFENVSFQIDTDWKLGFIGRNGRGKTTFLKLLMGELEYRGSISSSVKFDYFPLQISDERLRTLDQVKDWIAPYRSWEAVLDRFTEVEKGKETEAAEAEPDTEAVRGQQESMLEEYSRVLELYLAHDGYAIEERIKKETASLGIREEALYRPVGTLSYGEQTKIMLASLFLKTNYFLLIDEPTNHLDADGRQQLANYMKRKKGFIMVSHDRYFLNQVIDHVLSLNRCSIQLQKGNFDSWKQNKDQEDESQLDQNLHLKKEIRRMEEAFRRTKGWSDKIEDSKIGTHAADRGAIGAQAARMMKRAKVLERRQEKALEDKQGLLHDIEQTPDLKMNLVEYPKRKLLEAEELCIYYEDRRVSGPVSFQLEQGERVVLTGHNGCGKSSILKLILGEELCHTGRLTCGSGLVINYVSQDTSFLKGSLREYVAAERLDETTFKTVLRQLDFGREQFEKNMEEFSSGQKKKVLLARSLVRPAHLFIWDEPLNYVDIFSRIQLEELILRYQPTILIVEHDRMFAEKVATKFVRL